MVKSLAGALLVFTSIAFAQTAQSPKKAAKPVAPAPSKSVNSSSPTTTQTTSTTTSTATTTAAIMPGGPSVMLSQKEAAELVLKQGLKTKEVNLKYQSFALRPIEARSTFDWKFLAETGKENDRTESYSQIGNYNTERYLSRVSLSKSLLTGTSLVLDYSRTSQNRITPPDTTTPIHYDVMGFTLEQSLWGNFFGLADRATVRSAEIEYASTSLLRVDELEELVLETLKQFWNTYVAQESFKESLASKERYEKLVSAVKRKAGVGYANPGEYSQVQAEYETRIQAVKSSSVEYLRQLDNLTTLLGLPTGTEIKFSVQTELPPVPQLKATPIEDRRVVASQKMKVESAEEAFRAAKSKKYPSLNLVGRYGRTGLADGAGEAFSEVNSGSHPETYVGVKFQYNFGSDVQAATEDNKRAQFELEQARLQRQRLEQQDRDLQSERRVTSTFAIAESAKIQKEFREKAVQELTRTYNQGRTDISVLIEAMNKYFASEVQYVRAVGDYQIALNEWAAARDELIPKKEEK